MLFFPDRTPGGHRLYTLDDLKILWFVKKQQAAGRDLKEISECGQQALLQAARTFFAQESENESSDAESSENDIVAALSSQELHHAQKMIENLYSVSTSAIDFANSAACIRQRIRSPGSRVRAYCVAFFENLATHLCLDSILHSRTPPKHTALCLNYSLQNEFSLLIVALHLRRWGYSVTFLQQPPSEAELHELLKATKPLIACIGISILEQDTRLLQETLEAVSEHTLCCVPVPHNASPATLRMPASVYPIHSLLEFEILATKRTEDVRSHHLEVLKNFLAEYGGAFSAS